MDRLEMIDDIRKYANLLMLSNPNINYAEATKKAKISLFGREINFLQSNVAEKNQNIEEFALSYIDIARRELDGDFRLDLYTEEQLKEIIIAKRMGIAVEEFMNIFYTPLQIRTITLAASLGRDIKPYTTNLYFDPEVEMRKLEEDSDNTTIDDVKVYTKDKAS